MTTTELQTILPYILSERDYVIVTDKVKTLVESVPNYSHLCHIEASKETVNWKMETCPSCLPGENRLWSAKDWATAANGTRLTVERLKREKLERDALQARQQGIKADIIAHFARLGLPAAITEKTVIAGSDPTSLETIWQALQSKA